jgi:hypothetical protein
VRVGWVWVQDTSRGEVRRERKREKEREGGEKKSEGFVKCIKGFTLFNGRKKFMQWGIHQHRFEGISPLVLRCLICLA